jgi:hypothetical protein
VRAYCFVYLDHEERPVATTLALYFIERICAFALNYVNQLALWILGEKDIWCRLKSRRPMKRKTLLGLPYMDEKQIG